MANQQNYMRVNIRMDDMKDNYDLSERRAVSAVKGENKRRKNHFQKLGKTDYDNPFLYHLVLNMSKVSLERTLELVCKLVDPGKY
jgi:cytidylate kinase